MKIFFFIFIFLVTTSFNFTNESFFILSKDDWGDQLNEMKEAAISVPLSDGTWRFSYNKWNCFLKKQMSIETAEVDYNGWHEVPTIQINQVDGTILSFDLDPDEQWDTEKTIIDWKNFLSESDNVCIFAAYLQTIENKKMFYIEKIKFNEHYWDRSDEIFKLMNDTEIED